MSTVRWAPLAVDLVGLLPSWELHLRAGRTSPGTVKSYGDRVRRFLVWAWLYEEGEIDRDPLLGLEAPTAQA